jgi:toxin ParE1/3/4
MAGVRLAESAQEDLLDAWLHIARDNPTAADRVLDVIEREADALAGQPLMGRARPELGRGVRSWPTATPYLLFYLAEKAGGITILRILHHARDIQRIEF